MNGYIDAADYGSIDNWVQFPGTDGYANGDFNFDGVIDAADCGIIDNTIQLGGPSLLPSTGPGNEHVSDRDALPLKYTYGGQLDRVDTDEEEASLVEAAMSAAFA